MTWLRGLFAATVIMLAGLWGPPIAAQDIGVVRSDILLLDPERLFEETKLGQRMLADHQAERETLAARNTQLYAELEAEEKRLTELRAETPPADFREMADAFDAKVQALRQESDRRVRDLERDRERLPLVFLRTVEPVLTGVMHDAGGLVVLDARTVMFRAEVIDITSTAIDRIDREIGDGTQTEAEDGGRKPPGLARACPCLPGLIGNQKDRTKKGPFMTEPLKTADIHMIQRLIPHRYPFLLVDKVVDIDGYHTARGIKNVTMNEPHFQGHFPGTPIMPGVTIVEAMAQTAAVMVGTALEMHDKEFLIYFMAIENCKFRRKVIPGDVLELNIQTVRGKPGGKVWKFKGVAEVEGELASEAEFTAMLDLPKA